MSANDKITHMDAMLLNQRMDSFEKRLDGQQTQFIEVSNKMAVFEASLKGAIEEARRASDRQEKNYQELKNLMEAHTNTIFKGLNTITDALGLDGTAEKAQRLRDNIAKMQRSNSWWEETRSDLFKSVVVDGGKWLLIFTGVAIIMRLGFDVKIFGL